MRYRKGQILKTNNGIIEILEVCNPGYYWIDLKGKQSFLICKNEEGFIE